MADTVQTGAAVTVTDSPFPGLPNGAEGTVVQSIGGYFLFVEAPTHPSQTGLPWALTADEVDVKEG